MNDYPAFHADLALPRSLLQDSAQVVDSLAGFVPESPLPGGISDIVRFLFTLPQWFQVVGFIAGVMVAAILFRDLWRHRDNIIAWIQTRSQIIKIAMGVAVAVAVVSSAAFGMASWNFMQHDNDFCSACHVMAGPFTWFDESEHAELNCHDCHRQSIFASTRQLYLWVLERPVEIGEHSPVPNTICEECHVTDEPEVWQRVRETAGHRVHFESDSTALDTLMCVTCHGREVHRFAPVNETCGQSGCHENQEVTLAAMENQTALHCAACHRFVEEVPLLATADSARGTTVPALEQCTSCHEMQAALGEFEAAREPHGAACGTCHNPHTQSAPADAAQTCTTSGCHDTWQDRPFHAGPSHVNVGEECIMCHEPHASVVDPSDCEGCHTKVLEKDDIPSAIRQRLERSLPFDTTAVLRSNALRWEGREGRRAGADGRMGGGVGGSPLRPLFWGIGAPVTVEPPWFMANLVLQAQQDTFPHDRHTDLTCLNCHTTRTGHGQLNFEPPRGCQICHHQTPRELNCDVCHTSEAVNQPISVTVSVTIEDSITRSHAVDLIHGIHETPACIDCHTEQVTLVTTPSVAACVDCHNDHHTAGQTCVTCHESQNVTTAHAPPVDAHVGCDDCHDRATVAALTPDDSFCLTCHQQQSSHYEDTGKECTTCHFLETPEAFRTRLIGPEGGG